MHPDFSGSWRAILHESVFVTRTPTELTVEVEQSADWLRVEMRGSFEDIGDSRMRFKAAMVPADEVRAGSVALARWMGDDLVVETRIESDGEEVVLRDRWWLSGDGTRLTMAHRDDILAGQTVVFERRSG